jgi:hypothetical protein
MLSGMIRSAGVLCAVMAFGGIVLSSAPAAAQGARCAGNPLVGHWQVNRAKSKSTREIPPTMAIIAPSGADGIVYVFVAPGRDFVVPDIGTVQFDGKPVPLRGAYPHLVQWTRVDCNTFDAVTLRQVSFNPDGTVKEHVAKPQVQSKARFVVAPDGKTLTQTQTGESDDLVAYKDEVLVYDRR